MSAKPPLMFVYRDGVMVPRHKVRTSQFYEDGQAYALEEYQHRSMASHGHQFASIDEAWKNLPEGLAWNYPTPKIFRKKLLIQAGYCDVNQTVFTNSNDAIKAASLVLERDDYCVASVVDNILTIWTAKSQSIKAMGAKDFQASKTAILELAASMIGSDVATLTRHTAQAEA